MRERLLDVRGLEPPEPLERVLAEMETLGTDERICMVHRREPCLLYPILQREGFAHETLVTDEGEFRIMIWRK